MDYVFSVRGIQRGKFSDKPSASSFLEVPKSAKTLDPDHKIRKGVWVDKVLNAAKHGPDLGPEAPGDIVFYVHGYNTSTKEMLDRQRKIAKGLQTNGFKGVVVGFDWPSDDKTLNYKADRVDAKTSGFRLVDEGIRTFARLQSPECRINLHILAHSMGAYVIREAIDDADDRPAIAQASWSVSQILLVAADVSAKGMTEGSSKSSSLYRHCVRLTNYYSHFDEALSLSDVKRIGVAPRVGRVGLPADPPAKAVDVHCGLHYRATYDNDDVGRSHSWYFEDPLFFQDAFHTIAGKIDRTRIPTRIPGSNGDLVLGARP